MPRSHLQDLSEAHLGGLRPARRAGAGRRAPSRALSRPPPERAVRTVRTTLRRTVLTTAAEAIGVTFLLRGGPARSTVPASTTASASSPRLRTERRRRDPVAPRSESTRTSWPAPRGRRTTPSRARGGRPPGCARPDPQRQRLERQVQVAGHRVAHRFTPVLWIRTSCAAQRTRKSSLRVDSSPTRSESPRSWGSRPASARSNATVSSATMSHSRKNDLACESRKTKRALFGRSRRRRRPPERTGPGRGRSTPRAEAPSTTSAGTPASRRRAAGCWDAPGPTGRSTAWRCG